VSYSDQQSDFLAVVGMAGRFPGAADVATFWRNLADGVDCVTRFPEHDATGLTQAYGIMPDADRFDAAFFGYSPREAMLLDPQHRVFMECAWEALEDAGYCPSGYSGVIGIYGGCGDTGHFSNLLAHQDQFPGVSLWQLRLASGADFLTSRVAYKLGLTGPAVTVQTACSTSLVAVHMAAQALLAGDCDLALAGGVTVRMSYRLGDEMDDGLLASDGRCRAFDIHASGTVAGDGAGIVALKRLGDAIADGDHIHAVLRGSAVTNDGGMKAGFTAPGVDGQAAAVTMAQAVAGVKPTDIGYVEAHGTGTPVGDPIEVRALSKAFGSRDAYDEPCVLGSVKTNIGHTDAAAGVAGLIKAVLAFEHELIPATLHYEQPHPDLNLQASGFAVSDEARPWPRGYVPRRAAVHSLGIGGTNAHVILEEPPPPPEHDPGRPYHLLPLSARSSTALAATAQRLAGALHRTQAPIADVAWTLQVGRHEFSHRTFVACTSREEACRALAAGRLPRQPATPVSSSPPSVAFLFPGQGGQHPGMARDLYEHEPVFRAELDRCAELASDPLGADLRTVLYSVALHSAGPDPADGEAGDALSGMRVGQAAVFATEYALARLWQSWGVSPAVVLGHSLGAYAAAAIAGVVDLPDALALVLRRGQLLEDLPSGSMLAVALPESALLPLDDDALSIAAVNGPAQCVVTGPAAAVARLRERLTAEGVDTRPLHIGAAAHSSLVAPFVAAFERLVSTIKLRPPTITWISDLTGRHVTGAEACNPAYWGRHLRHTVRFHDALSTLLARHSGPLLELGPGRTLCGLARRHPDCAPQRPLVPSLPHAVDTTGAGPTMMTAAGELWQAGVPITWPAMHAGSRRLRTPLPTYPFKGQRFRLGGKASPAPGEQEPARPPETVPYARTDHEAEYAGATTGTERSLVEAFAQVLGFSEVGIHDSFFDLGGDSLMAAQLIRLIRDSLEAEITVAALFQTPTVAKLAQLLAGQAGHDAAPGRQRWLSCRVRRPDAALRLYCFPHSGGAAGEYMRWADWLPCAEVWGVQLPGRGRRLAEPPFTRMPELVSAVVAGAAFSPPFAFFGHSLGSLVAFECARALRERGLPGPMSLYLSATPAPQLHKPGPQLHALGDSELLAAVENRYGPMSAELTGDPELQQLVLTGMRADLEIFSTYKYLPAEPLTCPIFVFGGTGDEVSLAELSAWNAHTAASFSLQMIPGDHFYFRERADEFRPILAAALAEPPQ
jgi:phthiocerol/phenolphthiocerol synthesis type-I polyketide synthase E